MALTEGLGQAAAVRVSYCLSQGYASQAKALAGKVAFLASVAALATTSVFLMLGPNIANAMTTDTVLQGLLNDLVGITGLANVAMSFAQIYWNLTGAQNRYGLASCTILACRWFIVIPFAALCIFRYSYEITAAVGAVACGYATAALFLAWHVIRSDWELLAQEAQELDAADDFDMDSDEGEDEDSDDESSCIL